MSAAPPRIGRPTSVVPSEPFIVELDRFRGPLDLLLHLIRSQDIDIFDIPIARITRQFQDALEAGLEELELDRAGEFVELASTLVRIKSRMLLPRSGEPEWEEDPRADLVRRLLEYERVQEVVHVLASAEGDRSRHFAKGYVEPREAPERYLPELETTLEELLDAARHLPEPRPETVHRPPVRQITVESKISLLRRLLRKAKRVAFERLFGTERERAHGVAALLACLELARQQIVRLEQAGRFGAIWIFPGERPDAEPTGMVDGPEPTGMADDPESTGTTDDGEPAGPGGNGKGGNGARSDSEAAARAGEAPA